MCVWGAEGEVDQRKSIIRPLSVYQVHYIVEILMIHFSSATLDLCSSFHVLPGVSLTVALILICIKLACFYFNTICFGKCRLWTLPSSGQLHVNRGIAFFSLRQHDAGKPFLL